VSSTAPGEKGASIFTDRLYGLGLAAQLSWRDFRAVYPAKIYLATTIPRAILQVAFFGYLGYFAAGETGRRFAFVGAAAHIVVLATVVRGPDIVLDERVLGTLHRLRLGVLPLPAVLAVRWWIFTLEGVVDAVVAILVVAPLLGEQDAIPRLLAAVPLVAIVALSTSALGLVVGAISLTLRADVLLTNLTSYLLLVFAGVTAPISLFGHVGETVVRMLPLTNGLLAVRAVLAGRPWLPDTLLELAVGAGWLALGLALVVLQTRQLAVRGREDFY
jgi:ABC-2 type transport system permease protein